MKRRPGALAKALYNNTPETPHELLFRKGDILTVIEYDYEGHIGWWLCSHRGQRGICPSNYLTLLEDNYSFVDRKRTLSRAWSLTHSGTTHQHESTLKNGEGDKDFDPIETYDVPRSYSQQQKLRQSQSSSISKDDSVLYSNQPIYQNEDAFSPQITKTSPLDLYDVPRSQLPIYGQSISRARRYAQSEASLLEAVQEGGKESESEKPNRYNFSLERRKNKWAPGALDRSLSSASNTTTNLPGKSSIDNTQIASSTLPGTETISSSSSLTTTSSQISGKSDKIQLRKPNPLPPQVPNYPINHSNRSSVLSESAESGIVMVSLPQSSQDLYDVPRSSLPVIAPQSASSSRAGTNGAISPTRPESSLSLSSSGMGLSIANSDSKDSLDYDIPRSAKSYVNHMETKYDQVHAGSVSHHGSKPNGHSRHNSTSSVFSAYGYSRQTAIDNGRRNPLGSHRSIDSNSSLSLQQVQGSDLYDVPRSIPAPNPRASRLSYAMRPPRSLLGASSSSSLASSNSQASLVSNSQRSNGSGTSSTTESGILYDVPPYFVRKVSLCDSTETLNCQESIKSDSVGSGELNHVGLGTSSTSLSSSRSHLLKRGSHTTTISGESREAGVCANAEVKIMPLSPKAAVSVCEKLRHEVVTSISSILDFVKPKWRTKENLGLIMPDLRFSCTRLSLGIKDISDFATRCLSNAKQIGDNAMVVKLHRLLTPLINGSQIVQRDVDELEAYFWSVERLSISPGAHQEKTASGDALDQLILCARSLKHDVTEIANFLALNSSALFQEQENKDKTNTVVQQGDARASTSTLTSSKMGNNTGDNKAQQDDYDYVSLQPTSEVEGDDDDGTSSLLCKSEASAAPPAPPQHALQVPLSPKDEQLLEFYSAQVGVTAPLLSQSISTFISAIHQNEPPENFNVHLKYVILLAYRLLFAGDTLHRNVGNAALKLEIENRANDLHKSILSLYETSKVATMEFPKISPIQAMVDKIWLTTQSATQLKKVIFNATCTAL